MNINKTLTLFFSLMIILSLAISVNAVLDEESEMCLKPSGISTLLSCEDNLGNSALCEAGSTINASCSDVFLCAKTLTDYCARDNIGDCLFTSQEDGEYFYEPAYSPNGEAYPGYSDVNDDLLDTACETGCCVVTEGDAGDYFAFNGLSVSRVECEDFQSDGFSMFNDGIDFRPGTCADVSLDCGDVGDLIDTRVEECCVGFESFDHDGLPGDTAVCYDPSVGEPECQENNTPEEGWYYDTTSDLIRTWDCDLGVYYTTCEDTDGGYNYYSFGTATDETNGLDDDCVDVNYLSETVCVLGTAQRVEYECPFGCDVDNSVCLTEEKECSDTDNGINYFTQGVVSNVERGACCAGLVECDYNSTHNQCVLEANCAPENLITGNLITGMAASDGESSFVGKMWNWFIGLFTSEEKVQEKEEYFPEVKDDIDIEDTELTTELYEDKESVLRKEISVGKSKVKIYSKEEVLVQSQGLDRGQYILSLKYDKEKSPSIIVNADKLAYNIIETEEGAVISAYTDSEDKIPDFDVQIGGIQ